MGKLELTLLPGVWVSREILDMGRGAHGSWEPDGVCGSAGIRRGRPDPILGAGCMSSAWW